MTPPTPTRTPSNLTDSYSTGPGRPLALPQTDLLTLYATLILSLPRRFWSSDYRSGFTSAYSSLTSGIHSSSQLLSHITRRATSERHYASSLLPPGPPPAEGFSELEGSLKLGYEALVGVAQAEARARLKLAEELERGIAGPFGKWSRAHEGRVESSRGLIEGQLR